MSLFLGLNHHIIRYNPDPAATRNLFQTSATVEPKKESTTPPSLPIELYLDIISFVSDTPTLAALCNTNKMLNGLTSRYLYSQINLKHQVSAIGTGKYTDLLRTMREKPALFLNLTYLKVIWPVVDEAVQQLPLVLPHLKSLTSLHLCRPRKYFSWMTGRDEANWHLHPWPAVEFQLLEFRTDFPFYLHTFLKSQRRICLFEIHTTPVSIPPKPVQKLAVRSANALPRFKTSNITHLLIDDGSILRWTSPMIQTENLRALHLCRATDASILVKTAHLPNLVYLGLSERDMGTLEGRFQNMWQTHQFDLKNTAEVIRLIPTLKTLLLPDIDIRPPRALHTEHIRAAEIPTYLKASCPSLELILYQPYQFRMSKVSSQYNPKSVWLDETGEIRLAEFTEDEIEDFWKTV